MPRLYATAAIVLCDGGINVHVSGGLFDSEEQALESIRDEVPQFQDGAVVRARAVPFSDDVVLQAAAEIKSAK
jgi:hypothetical protein